MKFRGELVKTKNFFFNQYSNAISGTSIPSATNRSAISRKYRFLWLLLLAKE